MMMIYSGDDVGEPQETQQYKKKTNFQLTAK